MLDFLPQKLIFFHNFGVEFITRLNLLLTFSQLTFKLLVILFKLFNSLEIFLKFNYFPFVLLLFMICFCDLLLGQKKLFLQLFDLFFHLMGA